MLTHNDACFYKKKHKVTLLIIQFLVYIQTIDLFLDTYHNLSNLESFPGFTAVGGISRQGRVHCFAQTNATITAIMVVAALN